jgi:UDP-glucose 4-epimerase
LAILVTGGTGFIGAYLTRHLVHEQGLDDVVVFDKFPNLARLDDAADRITIVEGDVRELRELTTAIDRHGVDRIAHFAFLPGGAQPDRILPYLEVQVLGTANVFEAARLCGVKRVVQASSVGAYGAPRGRDLIEDDPLSPVEWYGSCKQMAEQTAARYSEQHGLEIVSFRLCACIGHGRVNRASSRAGVSSDPVNFLAYPELAYHGEPVTMPPDDQPLDVLYAADAAVAWWSALTGPMPAHTIFNLRGERRRVGDLTAHMRRLLPDAQIAVSDTPVPFAALVDNTRVVTELGFRPRYTLETGLEDYLARVERAAS